MRFLPPWLGGTLPATTTTTTTTRCTTCSCSTTCHHTTPGRSSLVPFLLPQTCCSFCYPTVASTTAPHCLPFPTFLLLTCSACLLLTVGFIIGPVFVATTYLLGSTTYLYTLCLRSYTFLDSAYRFHTTTTLEDLGMPLQFFSLVSCTCPVPTFYIFTSVFFYHTFYHLLPCTTHLCRFTTTGQGLGCLLHHHHHHTTVWDHTCIPPPLPFATTAHTPLHRLHTHCLPFSVLHACCPHTPAHLRPVSACGVRFITTTTAAHCFFTATLSVGLLDLRHRACYCLCLLPPACMFLGRSFSFTATPDHLPIPLLFSTMPGITCTTCHHLSCWTH